ncbi:hypothetical protein VTN00DRAFT_9031 [Thermoascus crustaceus]|uniref:uncharacterized protein n=1 Tax=Thermoascus crustaceus TaxID=5088 RepID=UPI0037420BEE
MPQTIYLAILSNGPRPAHWAIFIPILTPTPSQQHQQEHQQEQANLKRKGKVNQRITGNPATGFFLEFGRGYDFDAMRAPDELVPLAEVDERFVADTSLVGDGGEAAGEE